MKPFRLGPNQLHRFYRGGASIARFRGIASTDDYAPEDWVGSTTATFGDEGTGLSTLDDGRLLRDAVAADPEAFLGPGHVARHGADPWLLVKLLDAGERLPVHFHPDRAFAERRLGLPYGKTEAWLVVEARGDRPAVHLGFSGDVDAETLAGWVVRQDAASMLEAMNELPVAAGDCVFVPAGLPHAIGEGLFMVELQEPSDLSVLLEWTGFEVDGERDGHLGLGFEVALAAATRRGLGADELAGLKSPAASAPETRAGVRSLLPEDASAFFRAEKLRPSPVASLEPSFSILVVVDGEGRVDTEGGRGDLRRGDTVLVPYAAGAGDLSGSIAVIRCLPPAVED